MDVQVENVEALLGFKPRILVAEDDADTALLLSKLMTVRGYDVSIAPDGLAAWQLIQEQSFHCVVTDLRMPRMSGEELCKKIQQHDAFLPVIFVTAYGNIRNAVDAIKSGAFDYIAKPFNEDDLAQRVLMAVEKRHLDEQVNELRTQVTSRRLSDHLIGISEVIKKVLSQIHIISQNHITVLLTGESGTGKELVARTVHLSSKRRDQKFVTVNCGAIPENLMETELFGHAKGSFTGAIHDKVGLFEEAHAGTIFLDEIGDLPLALQVKLLRVLQEGEIRRVGSSQSKKVDVRLITATNKDLKKEVEQGRFREDLYYRINVFPINISPLRDRREDIPLLSSFFVDLFNKEMHLNVHGFSPPALKKMMRYRWPGNIRELQNKIKQAMVISRKKIMGPEDLLLQLPAESEDRLSFRDAKKKFEREYLIQVLKMTGGNITEASKIACKDRKDFYDVMKKHGIEPEQFRL